MHVRCGSFSKWPEDESRVFIPNLVPISASKAFAARKLGEHRYFMQDAAGGLVQTISIEKDYLNPETGRYLEKYLKGKTGVTTENRLRVFRIMKDLISSPLAGCYAMAISGGGG